MKTKYFLGLLMICYSFVVFAQDEQNNVSTPPTKEPKFWIGPKFGLDVNSTTTNVNGVTEQLKGNYQAGILIQYGRTLYIQPEIYYASIKQAVAGTTETNSYNSIRVPLMLGLRFLDLGLFSLHVMGGPAYTLKLDEADKLTGDKALSWQVGAGIDVLGFITGDLRYTLIDGMSIADQVTRFSTNPTILNLTVGLKLR